MSATSSGTQRVNAIFSRFLMNRADAVPLPNAPPSGWRLHTPFYLPESHGGDSCAAINFELTKLSQAGPTLLAWIIDPHCEFQQMCHFAEMLRRHISIPGPDGSSPGLRIALVFASTHFDSATPPLNAQTVAQIDGSETEEELLPYVIRLRQNQFFLRMFRQYGWSHFCHANRVSVALQRIGASIDAGNARGADPTAEYLIVDRNALAAWRKDVNRLAGSLQRLLSPGVWAPTATLASFRAARALALGSSSQENIFPGLHRSTLLPAIAVAHQFGRIDGPTAEDLMKSFSAIPWLTDALSSLKSKTDDTSRFADLADLNNTIVPPSPPLLRKTLNETTNLTMQDWVKVPDMMAPPEENRRKHLLWVHQRNIARASQYAFNLLTDASQILGKGAAVWAVQSQFLTDGRAQQPIRVLAVKDFIRDELERAKQEELFHEAFYAAFRPGSLELDCVAFTKAADGKPIGNHAWDTPEWWLGRLQGETIEVTSHSACMFGKRPGLNLCSPQVRVFSDYDIVLIEAEFDTRLVGPSITQWLNRRLAEQSVTDLGSSGESNRKLRRVRPQIFVMSRDDNAGHSFMCLWLGAQAFANKSRVMAIPALLTMANVGRNHVEPDTRRLRPHFFAIDGLLPHQKNKLLSQRIPDLVHGDEWDRSYVASIPKADLHYHIGTSIELSAIRSMAANTAGYLSPGDEPPEGSIAEVVTKCCQIILFFTLIRTHPGSNAARINALGPIELLWAVARFLLLPPEKHGSSKIVSSKVPPMNAIDTIMTWLVRKDRPIRQHEVCAIFVTALSVFESYFNELVNPENEFPAQRAHEGYLEQWSGLLLAAECMAPPADGKFDSALRKELDIHFVYLISRALNNWRHVFTGQDVRLPFSGVTGRITATDILLQMANAAVTRSCKFAETVFREFRRLLSLETGANSWLNDAFEKFEENRAEVLYGVDSEVRQHFRFHPIHCLCKAEKENRLSLVELVKVPDSGVAGNGNSSRSLQRYLAGSDLLGAEHMQFPENLVLAALDVTQQNVNDNVVYSELRCAPNGYCRAGMNVFDATDLLCISFDIASLVFGGFEPAARREMLEGAYPKLDLQRCRGSESGADSAVNSPTSECLIRWAFPPHRWVRSNILLGAKRHKKGDLQTVVNLVVHYLDRGREEEAFRREVPVNSLHSVPGLWWHRCAVVGFDLSGDEGVPLDDQYSAILPLFGECASITIHAGEAMSADSIWDAVQRLGAQRIGHGLRLRENSKLLEHCVRRGICMELCPISNAFTNDFREHSVWERLLEDDDSPWGQVPFDGHLGIRRVKSRDEYPIRDFLEAGLEVCLNTDNRSLHKQGTLTDEYLKAARLSRGLSRWEILRLCKAGFKNAFLPKDEVAAMLGHVEFEIYKIACEHSGEKTFPPVERFTKLNQSKS